MNTGQLTQTYTLLPLLSFLRCRYGRAIFRSVTSLVPQAPTTCPQATFRRTGYPALLLPLAG